MNRSHRRAIIHAFGIHIGHGTLYLREVTILLYGDCRIQVIIKITCI